MIFKAKSMKNAVIEAERFYKCDKKQLRVFVEKHPRNRFWGIARVPGVYKIELIKPSSIEITDQQNKDGSIEIISGKATVTNPLKEGRYASMLIEDPQIDVFVNGEKIYGAAIVTSDDRIEFKSTIVDPIIEINVHLSANKMQASLEILKTSGMKYFVRDAKRSNVVYVHSDYIEIQPPDVTLEQCLEKLEALNVDIKLVNIEKIEKLLAEPNGESAIVAKGRRPINGFDSITKHLFTNTSYRNPDFDTEKKVNLMDHTIIPTVEVGEVLAIKTAPAIPGKDGITVTGEVIKARGGKDLPLRAGNGAVLLDNGTKVIAASAGRPMYKNGQISVVNTLVISNDVDVATGNLHFDGDIVIKGNIADNLKVTAGGDITVYGNIYHADVYAKGNIRVHGSIINSRVSAGANILNYLYFLPLLKQIQGIVKAFLTVVDLAETSRDSEYTKKKLLQEVVKKKNKLNSLLKDAQGMLKLFTDEETINLIEIFEDIKSILIGMNARCIEDASLIEVLSRDIEGYILREEEVHGYQEDVIFENGQNSFILANGNIVVTDRGCYQTNLIAKDIMFRKKSSAVRGGSLIAINSIRMGVVGTPAGVSTHCRVLAKDGKIEAAHFYDNAVIQMNG